MEQDLYHTHILVRATIRKPPTCPAQLNEWFLDLVEAVGMKVLIPPQSIYCDTPGNEGITGIVCIETSHSSIHVWSSRTEPFLQFDLYSCKEFDPIDVIRMFDQFEPTHVEWTLMDRNQAPVTVLSGSHVPVMVAA